LIPQLLFSNGKARRKRFSALDAPTKLLSDGKGYRYLLVGFLRIFSEKGEKIQVKLASRICIK